MPQPGGMTARRQATTRSQPGCVPGAWARTGGATAGLVSARGPHTQCGRGQPRGRRGVPGCCQGKTAPGQVQRCPGEQHHGDQIPARPGPGSRCCLLAIGAGSG